MHPAPQALLSAKRAVCCLELVFIISGENRFGKASCTISAAKEKNIFYINIIDFISGVYLQPSWSKLFSPEIMNTSSRPKDGSLSRAQRWRWLHFKTPKGGGLKRRRKSSFWKESKIKISYVENNNFAIKQKRRFIKSHLVIKILLIFTCLQFQKKPLRFVQWRKNR